MAEQLTKSNEELLRENRELKRKLASIEIKSKLVVKKNSKLELAKQRQLVANFAIAVNRHKSREEIISELEISSDDFDQLHSRYYDQIEKEQEGKSSLRIFSEYVSLQKAYIKTLWDFVEDSKSAEYKNAQAFVAAIRAQSEFSDKIIKTGQELGVIVKTPDRILIVDGHDAREMDSAELRHSIRKQVKEVEKMIQTEGKNKKSGKVIQFNGLKDQQDGIVS